eukprot:gene4569-7953_t
MSNIKVPKNHERTSSYFTDGSEDNVEPKSPVPQTPSNPVTPNRSQSEYNLTRKNSMPTPKSFGNDFDSFKHSSHYNLANAKTPRKEGRNSRQDRKKMLSSFYGSTDSTPVTSPQLGGSKLKTISLTDDDIDTPHFNADRYVKSLLSKNDLNSLIDKDKKLCEETKSLDNEMQKLVYKNYNKFIIATETIKDMKVSVGEMEGKMKQLTKSIDEITETSTIINNNLATKRDKIESLSSTNRMLKKLQFLLVLPSRLTDSLALKAYSVAVRDYLRAEKILKQYRHLPSFQSIEKECMDIMIKLKTTLHESVKTQNIPRQTLITHHHLLFQLGESTEYLLKQFLGFREKELLDRLGEYKHQKEKDLKTNLQTLNKNFIKKYQAVFDLYKHIFEVPEILPKNSPNLKPILGEITHDIFEKYFKIVHDLFLVDFPIEICPTNLNFKENINNEKQKKKVAKSLEEIRNILVSLSTEISLVDEKVPDGKISNLLSTFLFDYMFNFLNLNLIQVKEDVSNSLNHYKSLSDNEDVNVNLTAAAFSKNIENDLIDIISELNNFFDLKISTINQKDNVSTLIDKTLEILDYLKSFLDDNSSKKADIHLAEKDERIKTTPMGALLLCKFAQEMEQTTSKSIIDRISEFDTSARAKFTSKFGECSSKMLVYYIEKLSDDLSEIIVAGIDSVNWKSLSKPPTGVSKDVVNYANHILRINKDVSVVFQDESDDEKSDNYSSEIGSSAFQYKKSGFGFEENSGFTKDVLKIFNQRLTRLAIHQPEFKRNYILNEIIKRTLKSFDESVRFMTFSKYGYQQIQVDTNYLQIKLRDILDDENFLRNLLKDIFSNVEDRCKECESLNHETVVELYSKEK